MRPGSRCLLQTGSLLLLALVHCAAAASNSGAPVTPDEREVLYPGAALPGAEIDPFGYSLYRRASFSPSGILYPPVPYYPWLDPPEAAAPDSDWRLSGFLALGGLFNRGDTRSADFREFSDFDSGVLLSRLELHARHAGTGDRLRLFARRPDRDDAHIGIEYRRPGRFRIGADYNRIPHVFAGNARVLFDGVGSGRLTLPDGLMPGLGDADEIRDRLLAGRTSTLALERRQARLFGDFELTDGLGLSLHAATERREGERPFGGTFAYPGLGQMIETVEPIDYLTHEIDARLHLNRRRFQVNFAYASSIFVNRTDNLVWDNPGLSPFEPGFAVEKGRTALAPDNRFHQFSADLAANLPIMRGRWTTSLAWNRKRQNDKLLPPTISSGNALINGTAVDLDLWNTVAALSQQRADARIDTTLAQTELTLQPRRNLRASLELRWLDEDNDTDFTTFNPLTGQFGTIRIDGGIAFQDGLFQPGVAGDLLRIRTIPHATDELDVRARLNMHVSRRTRVEAELGLERRERAHRIRRITRDRIARLQLTDRSGPWASLRLALEASRREGSDFDASVLDPFSTAILDGFMPLFGSQRQPMSLRDLREFDLASRHRHLIDAQLRFNPGTYNDISINARYDDEDFDAGFGLRARRRGSINMQWSRQLRQDGSAWLHYSFQRHQLRSRGINDAGLAAPDERADGPVFPLENLWQQNLNETNHAAGAGLDWQWGRIRVEADYTFSDARSARDARFASPAALAGGIADGTTASLPDQRFQRHLLRASVRIPIRRQVGTRLFWRFESERIRDPNFIGLDDPVVDDQLFLLAVPDDFDAHVFGILLEIGGMLPR